jgi:hypothetical protein
MVHTADVALGAVGVQELKAFTCECLAWVDFSLSNENTPTTAFSAIQKLPV